MIASPNAAVTEALQTLANASTDPYEDVARYGHVFDAIQETAEAIWRDALYARAQAGDKDPFRANPDGRIPSHVIDSAVRAIAEAAKMDVDILPEAQYLDAEVFAAAAQAIGHC